MDRVASSKGNTAGFCSPMHIWQGRKPLPLHCAHGVAAASCRGGLPWQQLLWSSSVIPEWQQQQQFSRV